MLYQYLTMVILFIGGGLCYLFAKRKGDRRGGAVFIVGVQSLMFSGLFIWGTGFNADWPWYMVMTGVIGMMSMPAGVWLGVKRHKSGYLANNN